MAARFAPAQPGRLHQRGDFPATPAESRLKGFQQSQFVLQHDSPTRE
jgi:hypothetical protein